MLISSCKLLDVKPPSEMSKRVCISMATLPPDISSYNRVPQRMKCRINASCTKLRSTYLFFFFKSAFERKFVYNFSRSKYINYGFIL